MVDERITDGDRIATVLRAELDGRSTSGLDRVTAEDDGNRISFAEGQTLATLDPLEDGLDVRFTDEPDQVQELAAAADLVTHRSDDGATVVHVESAAAVKRAVDIVATVAAENA